MRIVSAKFAPFLHLKLHSCLHTIWDKHANRSSPTQPISPFQGHRNGVYQTCLKRRSQRFLGASLLMIATVTLAASQADEFRAFFASPDRTRGHPLAVELGPIMYGWL